MKETEKFELTIKDGHLHINGYPTARRLIKLPAHPFGKKIGDLRLHQFDLMFCEQAMQLFGLHLPQHSPENQECPNNHMNRTIFWIAILAKFVGCFKKSKARSCLNKKLVFENDVDALNTFNYFETLRDKHLLHDENSLNTIAVGAVLGKNSEVIDILSLKLGADTSSEQSDAQNLYNLIAHTLKYLNSEVEASIQECLKSVREMNPEELEKMPDVNIGWPDISKIDQTRDYE